MTLDELIDHLEEQRDAFGGDTEVRLMTQQNWPFENEIKGVVSSVDIAEAGDDADDSDRREAAADPVIFLVEGAQLGYGNKAAWNLL